MDLLYETEDYISLQFRPKFYEIGTFELHINQYVEGAEFFQKNNLIMLDKRADKVMIIKHREISLDETGRASENWKITGYTLDGVLNQRITIPPTHTDYDRKSGDAETVMKHYVYRHFIDPDDPDRKIDFIEIAPNKHRGPHIQWESRYKNVGDEIVEISKTAGLGWTIYADMVRKKWIFDVIEPRDLTQDNPDGNPPVFFSPDFSTIKNQTFIDSEINYKNVAIVGGEGEGTERKIVKVGDGRGLERLEVFVDARDIQSKQTNEDGNEVTIPEDDVIRLLIERGEKALSTDYGKEFYLEAQILTPTIKDRRNEFAMATPFEYEKDFRLGDIVQVFNKSWNITMDAPITEFNEIYESSGFTLEAIFGEAVPTLISKIKREFDELKGIEKQEIPAKVAAEQMKQAKSYTEEYTKEIEQVANEAKNMADNAKSTADSKAKTFTSQPNPPYKIGDIWKNGTSTYICVRTRTSGSYSSSDWQKTGDVTSENTAKDTQNVNGTPANTIKQYAQWGKTAYDNQRSAVTTIDENGVNVKNGAFTLEEDNTNVRYSVTPARNLLSDHSFELVFGDPESMGQDSIDHNWLDMRMVDLGATIQYWIPTGKPKVAIQFAPDMPQALPMFGRQAIVLLNAQYVSQYVSEGIGAGGIYTLSAYFKRQWKCTSGGTPYLEVWHVNGYGVRISRIAKQIFDPVPSDYSIVRRAVTFTVPTNFAVDDQLEVIVSNGERDNKWIQCDGVQLVEGSIPAFYQSEDSIWELTRGYYNPINRQPILWAGALYPKDSQTIRPAKSIHDCRNGWVLEWESYSKGSGVNGRQFDHTHIPKQYVAMNSGKSYSCMLSYNDTYGDSPVFKYLYIFHDRIVGHVQNEEGNNAYKVLVAVYEY